MIKFPISPRSRGELESREFWGDEIYNLWKQDYESLMSFRKSLKGKPTEEQLAVIKMNAKLIEFYESALYHSPTLAVHDHCVCARCRGH